MTAAHERTGNARSKKCTSLLTFDHFPGKFEEINAHLPERFRGNARPNYPRSTSSPQSLTPVASVNLGIRAYIHAADNIKQASPKGWRSQPEFPASAEILLAGHEDVLIPANKIDGAWKSKEKYLKAHYNLLREDVVSPLRDAVELFRRNPDMMENDSRVICIYEKVNLHRDCDIGMLTQNRFTLPVLPLHP